MDNTELKNIIEAMLFISGSGVSAQKIASITEEELSKVNSVLSEIEKEYAQNHGIFLEQVGGKWKFTTKPQYAPWLLKLYPWKGILKLSPSAAEVLSIILYHQPITKAEINEIRGVDSSGPIATLLKHSLIKISGRKDVPGRPHLLRVSEKFYSVFGIKDASDIPSLDELEAEEIIEEEEL